MPEFKDIKDQKFGKLVAKKYIGGKKGKWEFECECGKKHIVSGYHVRSGKITRCSSCSRGLKLEYNGDIRNKTEWAYVIGISRPLLNYYLGLGKDLEWIINKFKGRKDGQT